jgi:opacity protein-like surface antigen
MKKMLLAAAALAVLASPALAQPYTSGNFSSAAYASKWNNALHRSHTSAVRRRAVRQRTPYGAYARTPGVTNGYVNGYRLPGARYDEHGYYIDPNSPGRW